MNKIKRTKLKTANYKISMAIEMLKESQSEIEDVQMDEEFDFDNLPEGFQEGIRGSNMQDAIDEMDDSTSEIESIIKKLEEIKNNLAIL